MRVIFCLLFVYLFTTSICLAQRKVPFQPQKPLQQVHPNLTPTHTWSFSNTTPNINNFTFFKKPMQLGSITRAYSTSEGMMQVWLLIMSYGVIAFNAIAGIGNLYAVATKHWQYGWGVAGAVAGSIGLFAMGLMPLTIPQEDYRHDVPMTSVWIALGTSAAILALSIWNIVESKRKRRRKSRLWGSITPWFALGQNNHDIQAGFSLVGFL